MLDQFTRIAEGRATALVRPSDADAIATALFDRGGCAPLDLQGRGAVFRFPLADGEGILRPYRRGGVLSGLLEDRHLSNRPLRELAVLEYLHRAGLAVPEPLGACWERRGPWLRGAIAVRRLEAEHLQRYLERHADADENLLRETGRLIRRMHDAGVFHADLQVRNILIADGQPFLIDFDGARRSKSVSPFQQARNLLRLRRSFAKNRLDPRWFHFLLQGHGLENWPVGLDAGYRMKGYLSDLFRRHDNSHER